MVGPIADALHDGRAVARIVAVSQRLRQRLGVDHDGVVGVVGVDGHLDVVEDDRVVGHAEGRPRRVLLDLGQDRPVTSSHQILLLPIE